METVYDRENQIAKVFRRGGVLRKIIKVKFCYYGVVFSTLKGRKLVDYDCLENIKAIRYVGGIR